MSNPYCSVDDLKDSMVGVKFDDATLKLAANGIKLANAKIEAKLSKRYDISALRAYSPAIPLLASVCRDFASGYVWYYNSRGGKERRAHGKELMEMALECLDGIAAYEEDLVDATGAVIGEDDTPQFRVECSTVDYTPTFAEDDPLRWSIDDDKLEDIEDSRD